MKHTLSLLAFLLLILLATLQAAERIRSPDPKPGSALGLTVRDNQLWRDNQPYRGFGVNYCDLFQDLLDQPDKERTLEGLRFLGQKKIPFVRFWAGGFGPPDWKLYFQDKDEWFRRMDRVVQTAEESGVGLIPSLFWRTETFPDLFDETLSAWADPNSKTRKFMASYTAEVVSRYRSSPAIWGWEFANEFNLSCDLPNWTEFLPQKYSGSGGKMEMIPANRMTYQIAGEALKAFAEEVRKLDPYRFITTGNSAPRWSSWNNAKKGTWTEDSNSEAREAFRWMHPPPNNLVSVHLYPKPGEKMRYAGVEGLEKVLRKYKSFANLSKSPLFVGEFCSNRYESKEPVPMDAFRREVQEIIDALVKTQVDLSAFWVFDYTPDRKELGIIRQDNEYAWILDALVEANGRLSAKPL